MPASYERVALQNTFELSSISDDLKKYHITPVPLTFYWVLHTFLLSCIYLKYSLRIKKGSTQPGGKKNWDKAWRLGHIAKNPRVCLELFVFQPFVFILAARSELWEHPAIHGASLCTWTLPLGQLPPILPKSYISACEKSSTTLINRCMHMISQEQLYCRITA